MRKDLGVQTQATPDPVLDARLAAWDKVIERRSSDAFFAKVIEPQKAWAKRIVGFQLEHEVSQESACKGFFSA